MFLIKLTDDGLADVKALEKNERNFLGEEIRNRLAQDPVANSLELNAPLEDYRSAHIGNYRVVFRVFEDLKAIAAYSGRS